MEPGAAELYDQALLGILQHVGNVQDFLRVLFGFLYRKTDFYRLLRHSADRMGFPPGAAQAMVLQVFKNFEYMARQDDERRRKELEEKMRRKEEEEANVTVTAEKVPAPAQEVEIDSTTECGAAAGAAGHQEMKRAKAPVPSGAEQEAGHSSRDAELPAIAVADVPVEPPALPKRQEQFQKNPDSYNGAVRENYTWSQDYSDLEVKVPVPKHVLKGKQVSVDLSSSSIRVAILEGNGERVLMEGKFTHKINTESSLWSLEPGKCVLVNLTRAHLWWQKVHEMLKKGWDAEGSPFRGQRFDPSMFNISPGAVQF
ncbi:nudC domain-containing protein 3 [Gracilinanus agilis]|uniref:nudC domain-containing protein 3 n=1 Tax=Gracilinanus agilis TaxID=191870 RepID=UPI001CFC6A48|nr:nudC domain-containing protein 3 [Gracilinanus agilis]